MKENMAVVRPMVKLNSHTKNFTLPKVVNSMTLATLSRFLAVPDLAAVDMKADLMAVENMPLGLKVASNNLEDQVHRSATVPTFIVQLNLVKVDLLVANNSQVDLVVARKIRLELVEADLVAPTNSVLVESILLNL